MAMGLLACSSEPQGQVPPTPASVPSAPPTSSVPADGGIPDLPDASAPLKPPIRCTLEGKEGWNYLPTTAFTLEGKLALRFPNTGTINRVYNVKGSATACDLTIDPAYNIDPRPGARFVTIERAGRLWEQARVGGRDEVYSPVPAPMLVCNKAVPVNAFSHDPSSITYPTPTGFVSLSFTTCAEETAAFDVAALTPQGDRQPLTRVVTSPRVWHLVFQELGGQTLFAVDKASRKKIAEVKLPYGYDPNASNAPLVFSCGKEDFCVLTRSVFAQVRLDPVKGYRVIAERNAADLGKAEGWARAQFSTPFTNFTSEEGRPADDSYAYVALGAVGEATPGRLLRFELVE